MRKIKWITKDAYLVVEDDENIFHFDENTLGCCIEAHFQETNGQEQTLTLASIADADTPVPKGVCSVFWRAVATSSSVKLVLRDCEYGTIGIGLPSGPLLSQFLRESPSLEVLEFDMFHFKEEHCRALATLQRNLKVKFSYCKLDLQYVEGTFIDWFQIVTELNDCWMDSSFISALSGNNSVTKITIDAHVFGLSEEKMRSLLRALPGNIGIEHLAFRFEMMSNETWILLFRSLTMHPRIKFLSIDTCPLVFSAESKSTMMNAIIQMLQLNTVVQTIALPDEFNNEEVSQNSILPRLEMNRTCFVVQRLAVKRADPSIRPQLLGRALHAVRYNPNLVFQFLSENVPAFVRTEDEEEDSAISLQNHPVIVSGQKRKVER
jgi:hypothetical protein